MTSETYMPGRWQVDVSIFPERTGGNTYIETDDPDISVSVWCRNTEKSRIYARLIVACVNACRDTFPANIRKDVSALLARLDAPEAK